jgi:hypothetical protein
MIEQMMEKVGSLLMMQEPGTSLEGTSLESALTVLHFTAQTYAQPTTTTQPHD